MAAFLRVYEPLDVLPDLSATERAQWRALASSGHDVPPIQERAAALRAASALPPRVVGDLDLVTCSGPGSSAGLPPLWLLTPTAPDGVVRACPAELSWRALIAVEDLRLRVVPELLDAVLPRAEEEDATRELAERMAGGARPPHVRHSNWYVPLTWFTAFQPDQRTADQPMTEQALTEQAPTDQAPTDQAPAGSPDGAGDSDDVPLRRVLTSVRYLAPMADARRCVARALAVARRVARPLLPEVDLEELGRWLEEFHARSVVELDFGAIAGLSALLRADQSGVGSVCSVEAVSAAIAQLRSAASQRDVETGIERLEQVRARWNAVRAFERAS
jgi:hypothetical protein